MSVPNTTTEKVEIAGAITYPKKEESKNEIVVAPKQPKQPTSMKDLLHFAMEAKDCSETVKSKIEPMDEEKKKFLESALKSMTVDIIEILENKIKVLQNAGSLTDDSDISEYTTALETILDYIDNIDTANDFHKIGGFTIFQPCVKCVHHEIRAGACDILAELCQNNPYCQKVVLENGFIPLLIRILANDTNAQVCTKALYALSCIVRQNTECFQQLLQHEGLIVLLKTFQKSDDKLRTKTAFLLSSLCNSQADLKNRLIFLNYIPVLLSILKEPRTPSHEHILSLLLLVIQDNFSAINECRNPKYDLNKVLTKYAAEIANKEECQEEEYYCNQLLKLMFPPCNNGL